MLLALEEPVGDDECSPIFISKGCRKIGLQLCQILCIDEDAWGALKVLIFFAGVKRQILGPAQGWGGLPFGVCGIGVHHRSRYGGKHPAVEF